MTTIWKIYAGLIFAAIVSLGGIGFYLYSHSGISNPITTSVMETGIPVIMRTPGGLLEVATLKVREDFKRTDPKSFHGIDLGDTVSQIQVPATYRYHIKLAKEWKVTIAGKICTVVAPQIEPTLPVAIDTANMQKDSKAGLLRFNKDKNLEILERSITSELGKRADLPDRLKLVIEPSRQTVQEYVLKWLIKEQDWKRDPAFQVKVIFQGEAIEK